MLQIDTTTYRATNTTTRSQPVQCIIIHSTEGLMPGCAVWLCNPKSNVSTDYIVTRAGEVYQLAPKTAYTWHAGVSALPGSIERSRYLTQLLNGHTITPIPSVNPIAIGVELEHVEGGQSYTTVQMDALTELTRLLLTQHSGATVLRHADVALPNGRKHDPTD